MRAWLKKISGCGSGAAGALDQKKFVVMARPESSGGTGPAINSAAWNRASVNGKQR